ncbi:unnamed protein product [Coffea canephora]|uniref:DH200=94 genomic scaffold, scaffold_1956 n=1 Tax=Coffea canephora TaxID=49390 RepID=A0A068VJ84_COFCA|nr:unnamed protein product [Coffea canephora]
MAPSTTSMGVSEKTQRTEIARPQVKTFHAKKRSAFLESQRPEQGKQGRPFAKKGRGAGGVKILETLRKDTPGGDPSGKGPLRGISRRDKT